MKGVGIADLKAHLSEHLKSVRRGRTLTVLDRNTPVARIVPMTADTLDIRQAVKRPRDVRVEARPRRTQTDSVAVLLEDRRRR